MRFGLTTPIVTLVPRKHAEWEESAGAAELRRLAEAADRLGYHHLTCSDHVAIPTHIASVRGGRYYDPFATLGFLAAITSRVRLVTHVLVLPYHHPLELAKRLGTLDQLSDGRIIAGVGVGTLREEFDLLGVEFETRGPRYVDALQALRAALSERQPSYEGAFFRFHDFVVDPCAAQARVPLWLGGRTPRSLRRALQYADGWDPFGFSLEQLRVLLAQAAQWPEWRARTPPLDLVLTPQHRIDVRTAMGIDDTVQLLHQYEEIGATIMNLQFQHRSLDDLLEQLVTFSAKVLPRL